MARAAQVDTPTRRPTREKVSYEIQSGIVIPPSVRSSIYPWEELAESGHGYSFFLSCDNEDHATVTRTSVQNSGRSYYSKRGIEFTVVSRIIQEDGIYGVRSWLLDITQPEEETEESED